MDQLPHVRVELRRSRGVSLTLLKLVTLSASLEPSLMIALAALTLRSLAQAGAEEEGAGRALIFFSAAEGGGDESRFSGGEGARRRLERLRWTSVHSPSGGLGIRPPPARAADLRPLSLGAGAAGP